MHVSSLQPNSGPTAGSTLVTLKGRFESASAGAVHCLFHVKSGLPSVSVVAMVHGPTQISCTAPACPPESCAEDISYASFAVRAEGSAPSRSSLIYTYFAPEKALEAQLLQVTPSGGPRQGASTPLRLTTNGAFAELARFGVLLQVGDNAPVPIYSSATATESNKLKMLLIL